MHAKTIKEQAERYGSSTCKLSCSKINEASSRVFSPRATIKGRNKVYIVISTDHELSNGNFSKKLEMTVHNPESETREFLTRRPIVSQNEAIVCVFS